jgi:hypothetical protein
MSATISKSQVQKLAKTMENINNVLQGLTVNESKISTKSAKQSAKKPLVKKKKKSIDNVESKSDLKKYTVAELSSFADKHRIKYTKKLKEILIKKIWKYLCSFDSDSDSDSDTDSSDSDSDTDSSDSDSSDSDSSDSDSD